MVEQRRSTGIASAKSQVALQPLTAEMTRDASIWSAYIAGSLDVDTTMRKLQASGFERISITGVTPTEFGISQRVDDEGAAAAASIPRAIWRKQVYTESWPETRSGHWCREL